jgi:hypothetical protein
MKRKLNRCLILGIVMIFAMLILVACNCLLKNIEDGQSLVKEESNQTEGNIYEEEKGNSDVYDNEENNQENAQEGGTEEGVRILETG